MSPLVPLVERVLIDFLKRHGATLDYDHGTTSAWLGPVLGPCVSSDADWIDLRSLADTIATEVEVLLIQSNVSVHNAPENPN